MNNESLEHQPVTREQVVEAYRRLKEEGIQPWDENEKAKAAEDLYDSFYNAAADDDGAEQDPAAAVALHQRISYDMILDEAGWADADNWEEIIDFLQQDLQGIEEAGGDEKTIAGLKEKIKEYKPRFGEGGTDEA